MMANSEKLVMVLRVFSLWHLFSSAMGKPFEDFDPHRTRGLDPIREKRELFEKDWELLQKIRSKRQVLHGQSRKNIQMITWRENERIPPNPIM